MKALGAGLALLVLLLVAGCGSDAAAVQAEAATAGGSMSIPELVRRIAPAVVHISTEDVTADQFGRAVPTGGRGTGAVLVGADGLTDLAVLKIVLDGLTIAPLGPSMELEVGETVVAMGHALDLPGGPTVTVGVVSALDRALTDVGPGGATLSDLIQTDASINPGNSGGPLLDTAGRVVGITSAGIAGSDNLGFAISIDGAREIIAELIASGGIERGFLGIVSATITPGIARRFELPVGAGVYVDRVTAGSAADAAGLRTGDIIVGLAGEPVNDQGDLGRVLARNKPGSEVEVNYVRGEDAGERMATVALGTRPAEE